MRDGERLRNQAVKTAGARKRGRKDEWALNESIMINQEASLSVSYFSDSSSPSDAAAPPCFPLRSVKTLSYAHNLTFKMRFGRPRHDLCVVIMKHVCHECTLTCSEISVGFRWVVPSACWEYWARHWLALVTLCFLSESLQRFQNESPCVRTHIVIHSQYWV